MDWTRYRRDEGGIFYYKKETFNDFTYHLEVYVDSTYKTEFLWFALSSGKKRKEFDIYEDKERESKGGIQALLWAKNEILSFPEWFKNPLNKKQYICIRWADSRRRDIYARLEKEGFKFQNLKGEKILIKKVI